jgi:hypothetical protein
MGFDQLRYFLRVADLANFTRAAEDLGISRYRSRRGLRRSPSGLRNLNKKGTVRVSHGEDAQFASGSDGTNWRDLAGGPMDNPDNVSIRTMLSHGGFLYVGTENNATGGELWAYDDGAKSWTHVKTSLEDASVAELAV